MNKEALSLIEKILKSNKFKFTGLHATNCKNTCIFGLFETAYCVLTGAVRIHCGSMTKRSSEFVLKGSGIRIGTNGNLLSLMDVDKNPIYATTKEELLKRLKNL